MARRRQFKGIVRDLAIWCSKRNFDYEGYWAVGVLYGFTQSNNVDELVLDINTSTPAKTMDLLAAELVSNQLKKDLLSKNLPLSWLKSAEVKFQFNSEYIKKYHYWRSGLGGKPYLCTVTITSDSGIVYKARSGGNVWVHDPTKEERR